ncbi:MAG: T9SS type A sorting domain-containing protein [Candidatus Kapabacteria bacterium]|nr:T9SS type A sorting domain-containing protein [Candidatus Kapabacteria bacterium]
MTALNIFSGKQGRKSFAISFLSIVVALMVLALDAFAAPKYEFSLRLRRMGARIGAEVWVKTLDASAKNLGAFTYSVVYNTGYLQPAALTYNGALTDSVDYDVNQVASLPYRSITSPFDNANGYNSIILSNGTGYAKLDVVLPPGEAGIQPGTSGRGTFVGELQFDIINYSGLSTSELTGISLNTTGVPANVFYNSDGTLLSNVTDISFATTTDMTIKGISILNPNGPNEICNRAATYPSLNVAGYPVYFERSGLINTDTYSYGTNVLAYAFDYSLNAGTDWTINVFRFAESPDSISASVYANYASGEVDTRWGGQPGYVVTQGNGNPLTSGGTGYAGVVRVIWKANSNFSARSEQARVKLTQLATSGTGTSVDLRARATVSGSSQYNFKISRLFYTQLDGACDYFKTQTNYSTSTQITVEAWINLNADNGVGSSPAIVVSSAGPNGPNEGPWMLYLKDGKYPAFRVREMDGLGTSGYLGNLVAPLPISVASAAISFTTSGATSEIYRKNWVHVAGTVSNDTVSLYVNGQMVAQTTNANLRMTTDGQPVWIGMNPNPNAGASNYLHAGIKDVKVWRIALSSNQILKYASGVSDANGAVTPLSGGDIRTTLDMYYSLSGSKSDLANNTTNNYQYGDNIIDHYSCGVINNSTISYRPDRGHIKLISPVGGEGIQNLLGTSTTVKWVGFGLGSTAAGTNDLVIEYSRDGGVNWADALDNTSSPAGLPLDQVAVEAGSAVWVPYNSVTTSGLYTDLQGVGNTTDQNYTKTTIVRIRGNSSNSQSDLYDVSSNFYVAPNFALRNTGGSYVYIPGTNTLNLSSAVSFMEAWIKPYRFPTIGEDFFPILTKGDSLTKWHYAFKLTRAGRLQLDVTSADGLITRTASSDATLPIKEPLAVLNDSVWIHVGVLVDLASGNGQTSVRFYIDGVPQASTAIKNQLLTNLSVDISNVYPAYIGYMPSTAGQLERTFIGEIKEVRFWNGYPASTDVAGLESVTNPTSLTKFVQGAQAVHANNLLTSPVNYQKNLVAAFTFNGGSFIGSNGANSSINSTNSAITAYIRGPISQSGNAISYNSTRPFIKLVEPTAGQSVANSNTSLRVRWVGFDFDANGFLAGSGILTQNADMEFGIQGGGGTMAVPYQYVASTKFAAGYTNGMSLPATDSYLFGGVTGNLQYASALNLAIANPDLNLDGTYNDQGAVPPSLKNNRLRLKARSTINNATAWEYGDISSLRTESPLFTVTPPSNFTVRMLLEGFHTGSANPINPIGDSYDNLGIKISLWTSVGGKPGVKVASATATGYDADASALNPTAGSTRGNNGSHFANIPFVFTSEVSDGNYFVLVEHLNHLPVLSQFPAPFKFSGDDLSTWAIESGWDFQSWGQNATPTTSDKMNTIADNIYSGSGLLTAWYNEKGYQLDKSAQGFDETSLNYTQGQLNTTSNRMAAIVAGDVVRDGFIDASDHLKVRNDAGSTGFNSDVTGDGVINAIDRDLVDRNTGKISNIKRYLPINLWSSVNQGGNGSSAIILSATDKKWADERNADVAAFMNSGAKKAALQKENASVMAGLSYKVSAEPVMKDNTVEIALYITNTGSKFAPGNCTFAINFDPNTLKFNSLVGAEKNIFSNVGLAYNQAYSAPKPTAESPVTNVRSIEIDYDGFKRPVGVNVPSNQTYLGTLVFDKIGEATEYAFNWFKSTAVLTTDGIDVTKDGTFDVIPSLNPVRNITITSPNGGENFRANTIYPISWTKSSSAAIVNLEFSADAGKTWNKINSTPIDIMSQVYTWTTPNVKTTEALVRLVNNATGVEIDRCDAVFTIMPVPAQITRPVSADPIYVGGSKDVIKWAIDDVTSVRFEFSSDNMASWTSVSAAVNSSSKQVNWTVPSVNSKFAYVRMIKVATGEVLAISEKFRILAGTLSLTAPTSGAILPANKQTTVTWKFNNVSKFDLQLSNDCGNTWVTFATGVYAVKANYPWLVANVNTTCAFVRAIYSGDPELEYSRTAKFSITGAKDVNDPVSGVDVENARPNPFSTSTNVNFYVGQDANVSVTVYNSTGMKVATLVDNKLFASGNYSVTLDGTELPQGMYFIHFNIGTMSEVRQAVLVK